MIKEETEIRLKLAPIFRAAKNAKLWTFGEQKKLKNLKAPSSSKENILILKYFSLLAFE